MIDPQLIFQNPDDYLQEMTAPNAEGQYYDRKAVGPKLNKTREGIKECISAFTNSRGGLIAIGINNDGSIQGLDGLSEADKNSLVQVKTQLVNHATQTREVQLDGKYVILFYVPIGLTGICETIETHPAAWIRDAANCLPLSSSQRESLLLERNKKWEQLSPCEFDFSLVNTPVFEVFKKRFLEEIEPIYVHTDEELALYIGLAKKENGKLVFTNAGYVFFANNPTSLIPSVQVRFLRYDCNSGDYQNPTNLNFDKTYDGCLPELLRKSRVFINQSAFFRTYMLRNTYQSGIIEEDEFPPNAVEEAIVNALIHRDYNIHQPTVCILYRDAFVVRNPGKLLQPNFVPSEFDLSTHQLEPFARNPKIVSWARTMVDENGQRFVKHLSEGNRTMLDSMLKMGLPAPVFNTNHFTTVTLYNNYEHRNAQQDSLISTPIDEFGNLFLLKIQYNYVAEDSIDLMEMRRQLHNLIKDKLINNGWFIDHIRASRIITHRRNTQLRLDNRLDNYFRIYPAYSLQFHLIDGQFYLSIDYEIQLVNIANLSILINLGLQDLQYRRAQIKYREVWTTGIIENYTEHYARVRLTEFEISEDILTTNVIPVLGKSQIDGVLKLAKINYPLSQKIKEFSLANKANSARERAEKILEISKVISQQFFPLSYNTYTVFLNAEPVHLNQSKESTPKKPFDMQHLSEPNVRIGGNQTVTTISNGLTQFGGFDHSHKDLEIIPLCVQGQESGMEGLLETLRTGSLKFKGMERTFGLRPSWRTVISKPRADDFLDECKRLLTQNPDWIGDKSLKRIFLIHIPEEIYSINDWMSPYFSLKEYLLENGVPVQMVDTPTLNSPIYKDLNLSLNIMAKTGGIPWVLPDALPEVDVFIGLSYTQYKTKDKIYRTIGYANVFNAYGQWQYYKGNNKAFNYEDKHYYLAQLVQATLVSLKNLPENANIQIHYSAKFNKVDREAIFKAARQVRSNARVTFVWINTGHNIRLFDKRSEGNGSLIRGTWVYFDKSRFYLSTTGYTTIAKTLGTPIMLEANVISQPILAGMDLPLGTIAKHLLALTKLNWASSQSINGEPVTIKYARDIARLSHAFLQRKEGFTLHPVLEPTAWFI